MFFFLLILFLPTQFGKHFWPDFAYVLGQQVDYLAPTVYFSDILIVGFIILSFLKDRMKNPELRMKGGKIIIVLLFLFLSIGIYFSASPFAGWYYLLKLFEFILLGFAMKHELTNRKHFGNQWKLLLPLSIGIIFESLLAIVQFLHQGSLGGMFYYLGERTFSGDTPGIANASLNGILVLRPYATFPHPNVLAAYLLIGMTILIFNFQFSIFNQFLMNQFNKYLSGNFFLQMIIFIALIAGTIALFLTFSRVAIFLWLIILSFLIGHALWSKIKHVVHPTYYLLFIPSVFLSMLILLFTFFPDLKYRIPTTGLSDESVSSRIELMQAAQQMVIKNPVFGVGFGNFLSTLPFYLIHSHFVQLLQPVHNIFYLIAAETGIPGLLFFLWFLGKTLFASSKRYTLNAIRLVLLSFVVTLGMFDHYFLTLQQGQLLLTFVLSFCWA